MPGAFASFQEWEAALSQYSTAQAGSPLGTDDAAPHYPVSQFAYPNESSLTVPSEARLTCSRPKAL
jgi:hypothetical protein